MKPNKFGIHFIVRNNRVDKKGKVPIYNKVSVDGQKLLFSLNHSINSKEWDYETQRPIQNCSYYEIILNAIESFRTRVYLAYSNVIATNQELTATNLKFEFLGRKEVVKTHTLIEAAIQDNTNFESLIGIKIQSWKLQELQDHVKVQLHIH